MLLACRLVSLDEEPLMWLRRTFKSLVAIILLVGVATAGYLTRELWLPYLSLNKGENLAGEKKPAANHVMNEQVKLSPQAQSNLKLVTKPLQTDTHWRTFALPGTIID